MNDFIVQALSVFPLLVGVWLTGNNRLSGPALSCFAEIFVVIVGVTHSAWSIVLIGVCLGFVQARNFFKWKKEGAPW